MNLFIAVDIHDFCVLPFIKLKLNMLIKHCEVGGVKAVIAVLVSCCDCYCKLLLNYGEECIKTAVNLIVYKQYKQLKG